MCVFTFIGTLFLLYHGKFLAMLLWIVLLPFSTMFIVNLFIDKVSLSDTNKKMTGAMTESFLVLIISEIIPLVISTLIVVGIVYLFILL